MNKDDILAAFETTLAEEQAEIAAIAQAAESAQRSALDTLFAAIDASMGSVGYQWEPPEVWGDKQAWWMEG